MHRLATIHERYQPTNDQPTQRHHDTVYPIMRLSLNDAHKMNLCTKDWNVLARLYSVAGLRPEWSFRGLKNCPKICTKTE